MKRILSLVLGAGILAVAACREATEPASPGSQPSAQAAGQAIPGEYIVVFRRDVPNVPDLARRLVAANGGTLRFTYEHALKGFAAKLPDFVVPLLRRNPDVAYVEQDQIATAFTTQTNPPSWGLDRIDQRNLPLSNSYSYTSTGSGVTAYIIDTGIFTSDGDFGSRATVGFDAIGDGQNGIDCNGHGTHVAGTVGGSAYGVAKAVTLKAVRVLNCSGSGSYSQVIAGINYVTGDHASGALAVANMSLGGGFSQALNDAVTASINDGVTYAVAAGNGNFFGMPQNACNSSPASTPNALTVGATDKTDHEASFSNYGTCVDLLAPGVGITSDWLNGGTNTISGTSMATPHVTGVAALYLQSNPSASAAQVATAIRGSATSGVITLNRKSRQNGTPNKLLYTNAL